MNEEAVFSLVFLSLCVCYFVGILMTMSLTFSSEERQEFFGDVSKAIHFAKKMVKKWQKKRKKHSIFTIRQLKAPVSFWKHIYTRFS